MVEQSSGKEEKANYLAQVLHAANMLHRHKEGEEWELRRLERGASLADLDNEIDKLTQVRRDIDDKLDAIDDENVERTRGEIDMLEKGSARIERELVSDQRTLIVSLARTIRRIASSNRISPSPRPWLRRSTASRPITAAGTG